MRDLSSDARARKTRVALYHSFAELISEHRYENLKVADITARAGISRSTFYAHYPSKDALLAASIAGPFAVLADTIGPDFEETRLIGLLKHFWGNRGLARGIPLGAQRKTISVLVRLILDRLKSAGLRRRGATIIPPRTRGRHAVGTPAGSRHRLVAGGVTMRPGGARRRVAACVLRGNANHDPVTRHS